jgi:hypothetical protein
MAFSRRKCMFAMAAWATGPALPARAAEGCATTILALRALLADSAFPLRWYETTMDDDKPLVLSISERDGSLCLEFVKTGEGLWIEANCTVCRGAAGLEARFNADQVRIGPACNLIVRFNLSGGGTVSLTKVEADRLRIDASGWTGTFSPRDPKRA